MDAETGDFRYDEPLDYVPEGWERNESKNYKGVYFYRNRTSGAGEVKILYSCLPDILAQAIKAATQKHVALWQRPWGNDSTLASDCSS